MKSIIFLILASINFTCFSAIQATKYYVDTQIKIVNDKIDNFSDETLIENVTEQLPSIISNTFAELGLPTVQTNYVDTIISNYYNEVFTTNTIVTELVTQTNIEFYVTNNLIEHTYSTNNIYTEHFITNNFVNEYWNTNIVAIGTNITVNVYTNTYVTNTTVNIGGGDSEGLSGGTTKLYNHILNPNCAGSVYIISNVTSGVFENIYIGESNLVESVAASPEDGILAHDIFKSHGLIRYEDNNDGTSNMWQKIITAKRYFSPEDPSWGLDAYYQWSFLIQELEAVFYNGVIYTNTMHELGFKHSPEQPEPLPFPFEKGKTIILEEESYPYNKTGYSLTKFDNYDVEFDSYLGDNYSLISMLNGKIDSVSWKSDLDREVDRLNAVDAELQRQINNSSGGSSGGSISEDDGLWFFSAWPDGYNSPIRKWYGAQKLRISPSSSESIKLTWKPNALYPHLAIDVNEDVIASKEYVNGILGSTIITNITESQLNEMISKKADIEYVDSEIATLKNSFNDEYYDLFSDLGTTKLYEENDRVMNAIYKVKNSSFSKDMYVLFSTTNTLTEIQDQIVYVGKKITEPTNIAESNFTFSISHAIHGTYKGMIRFQISISGGDIYQTVGINNLCPFPLNLNETITLTGNSSAEITKVSFGGSSSKFLDGKLNIYDSFGINKIDSVPTLNNLTNGNYGAYIDKDLNVYVNGAKMGKLSLTTE
jgi:hypothetical protein